MDLKTIAAGGSAGHFGMPGMHERAKLIGGRLEVQSHISSGTVIELIIPASLAYANAVLGPKSMSSGSGN